MIFKIFFVSLLILLTIIRFCFKKKYYKLFSKDYIKYEPIHIVLVRIVAGFFLGILVYFMLFEEQKVKIFEFYLPYYVRFSGLFISSIGILLLIWSHISLRENFTTTIILKENHRFVKNGPYKYIRHPMYVSYIIFFIGLVLVSTNWLFGILSNSIILSLMYLRLPLEEKKLLERFREYEKYLNEVPAFIPKFNNKK